MRVTSSFQNHLTNTQVNMPTVQFGPAASSPAAVEAYRTKMLPYVQNNMRLPSNSPVMRDGYAFATGRAMGSRAAGHAMGGQAAGFADAYTAAGAFSSNPSMVFVAPPAAPAANALVSPFSSQFATGFPAYLLPQ